MKRILTYSFLVVLLCSCGGNHADINQLQKERDELASQLNANAAVIQALRDSIVMLSFPADQRLIKINNLVSAGEYSAAKQEISELNDLFPNSKEAQSTPAIIERVDKLISQKKAAEDRIKALGFKALKASTTITVGYNKVELSNISVGTTFTFDSNSSYYTYRTADRGNKYITAAMKITSEDKNPKLPQLAIYQISGDSMIWKGNLQTEFARWDDYGSYLGNYHDNGNDFAKTSTVKFKVGVEVSEDIVKGPYALVLKKENVLIRTTDKYENPPVSYTGSVSYPNSLKLDDFTIEGSVYAIVKITNL